MTVRELRDFLTDTMNRDALTGDFPVRIFDPDSTQMEEATGYEIGFVTKQFDLLSDTQGG